jgi:hypothetical protein
MGHEFLLVFFYKSFCEIELCSMMGKEHNYLCALLDSRNQVVVGVHVIKLSKRHERKMVLFATFT